MSERILVPEIAPQPHHDDASTPGQGSDYNPEILDELHAMFAASNNGDDTLDADARKLERRHGPAVYSELIRLLSHLSFPASEAKPHWDLVVRHRESMQERLGKKVDLRVALVSYFLEVNRKLRNPKIIEMRLFELERASAYRDELTGLYNYRLFREHLTREVFRAARCGKPLSLVMVDLDEFKRYNDCNGHEIGNQALTKVARLLTTPLRKSDIAARYGGEEFVLVLPSTPKTNAQIVAERARAAIEREPFTGEEDLPDGRLTVSMGVATFPADATNPADLIRQADRALYIAKARGKNQISLYGHSRRSFGRAAITLPGTFRMLADESHTLSTVNLSEAGLLFRTDTRLQVGTILEFTLQTDPDRQITAAGRVVHVEVGGDGTFRTAVHVTDACNADRAHLMAMVRDAAADDLRVAEPPHLDPVP
jgi:diguanylate cyclase (GGDEF)-like protein